MEIRSAAVLVATASLVLVAGCGSPGAQKAKSPSSQAQQGIGQTETTSAPLPLTETGAPPTVFTPGLSVSEVIAKACGIAPRLANAATKSVSPSFDYDSAALGEEDRAMLAQVAKCLTEGALRGRGVKLVGRADPRGEPEYNMTLGGSRANSVRRYMVDLGVGTDRLNATSRGELDATGTNEQGWAQDRRVDIELAQ
ncbi:MAG: OmpA family protein [Labilithrix sp.]|nr:OmpA family protein [Labilithrix sp.]